ncbi:MAG: hypothetical protein GQ570_08510 [Helicobacteraceae bacterium]|nr:hypothetical protein [Helicobacteraceae bacterium]
MDYKEGMKLMTKHDGIVQIVHVSEPYTYRVVQDHRQRVIDRDGNIRPLASFQIIGEVKEDLENPVLETRGNGGTTSYYELPTNATELGQLIKHKKMEHGIGEAFCALYRLNDNGEYKRNLTKALYYIQKELDYYES